MGVLTLPANLLEQALDRINEFCSRNLLCPPPSRLVNLLVENRSLYATYGKRYGQFVDNPHGDNWHSTWQLAVTLAEAMNRKNSLVRERKESISNRERQDSANGKERKESITRRSDEDYESDNDNYNKESLAKRYPEITRRKGSIPTRAT